MRISTKAWDKYIRKLSAIDNKAGDLIRRYIEANGLDPDDTEELIQYAYRVSSRYGQAAAAVACEMYDATAIAQGVSLAAAVPAEVATFSEVAASVNATRTSEALVPQAVSRLVKQAAADTTLQNAARDKAEYAWIAVGDTCAYCIAISAEGWKPTNYDDKYVHADHIHANCDCQFAVRFDHKSNVSGYNPDRFKKMYYNGGQTAKERINNLRRMIYEDHKDEINAQKRAAYAARVEAEEGEE